MGRKPRSSADVDAPFDVGAKVEVRTDEDGFRGAWYEATVVSVAPSLRRRRKSYSIVYDSLLVDDDPSRHLSEVVPGFHVRPRPPRLGIRAQYALHQLVDAYHNDGWWNGVVAAAGGGDGGGPPERYTVAFHSSREVVEFSTSDIRPHVQWMRGRWVFPDEQAGALGKYKTGAEVEISCDRENFGAFWLLGVVKKAITKRIYLVEYKKLKEDGGSEVVKEILDVQYIRPKPPTRGAKHLAPLTEVEVFYHGGWSAGVLLKNLEDSKCIVKLKYSHEEIESSQSELRPQREWIASRWCLPKEKRRRRSSGSCRRPSHPVSVSESSSSDVNNEATCESQWDEIRCNEVGLKRKKEEGSNCERQTKLLKPCKLVKKRDSPDQLWKDLGPRTPSGEKDFPAANPNLGSPSNRAASSPCEVPGVLKSTLFENLYPRPSFNGRAEFLSGGEEASKLEVQESEHQSKAQNLNHSPLGLDTCDFLVAMNWEHNKGVRRLRLNAKRRIKKLAIRSPLRQGRLPYIDLQQHAKEILKRKNGRPPKSKSTADRLPPTEENSTGRELRQSEGTADPVVECEQRREDVDECNQGVAGAAPNGNKLQQLHDKVMEHKTSLIADIDDGVISSQSNEFLVLEKSTCMERQQSEGISGPIIECEQRRKDADACNQGVFGATPNGNKLLLLHDEVMECKNSKLIADLDGNGVISSQSNEHAATMLQTKSLCQDNTLIESLAAPNLINVSGSANAMGEQMSNVNYGILGEGIETQNKALPSFNEGSEFMTASSFGTRVQENSCYDGLNAGGTEFEGPALLSSHSKEIGGICYDPISSPLQSRRTGNEEGTLFDISRPQLQPVKIMLPFAKSSCLWESIESMEIFRVMPQRPHFRQLEKDYMVHREGRAIGLMVTFANLAANICKLQISDSETKFEEILRALMPLEEYGFDVRILCSRIEGLLKIRNGQWQSKSKRAMLEGQILERENESNQLSESTVEYDESIMELEQRLACLHEKRVIAVLQREAKESEIIRLKKEVQILEEDYMAAEQHFGTLKASSWQQ